MRVKISKELSAVPSVTLTTDCWSSRAMQSYITVTAHIIDDNWNTKAFTLTTHEMLERHTSDNLASELITVQSLWDLENKTTAIVTDNAANVVRALGLLDIVEKDDVTCAAHSVQLAANKVLSKGPAENLCKKASKLVAHFRHSNVSTNALHGMQEKLSMKKQTLLQSCITRWNSTYNMLERLLKNRIPITNVLSDRSQTQPLTGIYKR